MLTTVVGVAIFALLVMIFVAMLAAVLIGSYTRLQSTLVRAEVQYACPQRHFSESAHGPNTCGPR